MKLLISIIPAVLLIVYSQLITKWRATALSTIVNDTYNLFDRIQIYIKDPYIITSYLAALLASVMWIFVVEKYDVSIAFPLYVGLSVLFVSLGGFVFFSETFSLIKTFSISLIILGVALGSKS